MTYGLAFPIEYLSNFATLLPGDLVLTGSPGRSAPIAPGDLIEIEIEINGTLVNGVIGDGGN